MQRKSMILPFHQNILLSDHTTIRLGGEAKYFISCGSENEIKETLRFARQSNIPLQVIAGGSNTIFPDEGYPGIVLKVNNKGVNFKDEGTSVVMTVAAGENWDDIVKAAIEKGLTGIECLSGIPGSAGAVPVQNVGAYGQEVNETIVRLKAIDRESLEYRDFRNSECEFGYRTSRFKFKDKDKFIITEIVFELKKSTDLKFRYPELKKLIESDTAYYQLTDLKDKLRYIRKVVIELRSKKSMVIDPSDINTRSCGSFFINPVIDSEKLNKLQEKYQTIPYYQTGERDYKIPAAWLVENAGFKKGYKLNGAGISANHSLAIINIGGGTVDILALASKIMSAIKDRFDINLKIEPEIVDL